MEHVIASYLRKIWDEKDCFAEDQYGFRAGYSCESQVITYKYYVLRHYPSSCLYLKHRPVYFSKHNKLETGFCLRFQARLTQLGPIDRASPYLWTLVPVPRWDT
jgi:hypothetical protein